MLKKPLEEERGSILFLVILSAAALLLLGTAFLRSSLQEKLIARNYTQKIRAHYIAEAGMEAALTVLRDQPDYFLEHGFENPVYMYNGGASGQNGEYFELEWRKSADQTGPEEFYTLTATGYTRSTFENRSARAEIKALMKVDRVEEEDNTGDEDGVENENGAGNNDDSEDGGGVEEGDTGDETNVEDESGTGKTSITLLYLSGQ
jgi:Tfp pilus assembly protein PilX